MQTETFTVKKFNKIPYLILLERALTELKCSHLVADEGDAAVRMAGSGPDFELVTSKLDLEHFRIASIGK